MNKHINNIPPGCRNVDFDAKVPTEEEIQEALEQQEIHDERMSDR